MQSLVNQAQKYRKLRENTDSLVKKWQQFNICLDKKWYSNLDLILNEIDRDHEIINEDILTDSNASKVVEEVTALRSDLELWRNICLLIQRLQSALIKSEDLFFNHELQLKDFVEENKKMRDIGRQFNKMNNECLKEQNTLCKVVQKMLNLEKRDQSFKQNIEENTPILEGILSVIQSHLHKLRLEKINIKIISFLFKDCSVDSISKII